MNQVKLPTNNEYKRTECARQFYVSEQFMLYGISSRHVVSERATVLRSTPRTPRIALYSHDTLGYGHWRRNTLLASELRKCASNPDILIIAGMRESGSFDLPDGVDTLTLPAYAKQNDGSYGARSLGVDLNCLSRIRAETIKAALLAYEPDLFIVDNVPRGAQFELDLALHALRKRGRTRLVLGLRDVIDSPDVVRKQWLRQRNFEALRQLYDDIWIYGDPRFYNLIQEYGFGPDFATKARFTGYLDQSERFSSKDAAQCVSRFAGTDPRPYIFCAVGGGRDGGLLATAFAKSTFPVGHRGILVAGSQMPLKERELLSSIAASRDDLTVTGLIPETIGLMKNAERLITMGGYNTICEILTLGKRALVVPRVRPRMEQALRAKRLAEKGLIDVIHPDAVSPDALSDWLAGVGAPAAPSREMLDLEGLAKVRYLAEELLVSTGLLGQPGFEQKARKAS